LQEGVDETFSAIHGWPYRREWKKWGAGLDTTRRVAASPELALPLNLAMECRRYPRRRAARPLRLLCANR
jgi:hypothetical protein